MDCSCGLIEAWFSQDIVRRQGGGAVSSPSDSGPCTNNAANEQLEPATVPQGTLGATLQVCVYIIREG